MLNEKLRFLFETPNQASVICAINEESFGPGRFVLAAMILRERGQHDLSLSFVCKNSEEVIGSVRMTPISIRDVKGHLLGPLIVRPLYRNKGIGKKLIQMSIDATKKKGSEVIILVGDFSYYEKLGFKQVPWKAIKWPAPVDPKRVLFFPLVENVIDRLNGTICCREVN